MVSLSGLLANYPGLVLPNQSKLPFQTQRCNRFRFNNHNVIPLACERIRRGETRCFLANRSSKKFINYVARDYHQSNLNFEDDAPQESFWSSLIKESIWALKSLFVFLAEQPSQLKYLEWPGFQSTLKTATLTLALVAVLIVALSSVDSALSFLLAVLLRRTP